MKLSAPYTFVFVIVLTCVLPQSATAEIYSFTDENGVVHFSNVPTDPRYVPLRHLLPLSGKTIATTGRQAEPKLNSQYGRIIEEITRTYGLESALIQRCGLCRISLQSHGGFQERRGWPDATHA